jgi:hypothetical protein
MLRQASRLSIKTTGNPAFFAGRSHQQYPAARLLRSAGNDMLCSILHNHGLAGEARYPSFFRASKRVFPVPLGAATV